MQQTEQDRLSLGDRKELEVQIKQLEEYLEKRRKRYNPHGGAIHPEESYEERNRPLTAKANLIDIAHKSKNCEGSGE